MLVLALLLAVLVFAGWITPWQLFVVGLANGLVQAVDLPARLAFVMDLVGREDLVNAVALNAMLFNVARILGPALGGLLLLGIGPGTCFLLNGVSYFAVLWALLLMDIPGQPRLAEANREQDGFFTGFIELARKPRLACLVTMAGFVALCGWPFIALLPAFAEHVLQFGARGYSLMLSSTGVGALTAALVVATWAGSGRRRWLVGLGIAAQSSGLLGLSLASGIRVAAGCCAAIGFGLILFLATSQGSCTGPDDRQRGRVMGIWAMILSGAVPLGNLLTGFAADHWGEALVLGQGVSCILSTGSLLVLLWLAEKWRTVSIDRG